MPYVWRICSVHVQVKSLRRLIASRCGVLHYRPGAVLLFYTHVEYVVPVYLARAGSIGVRELQSVVQENNTCTRLVLLVRSRRQVPALSYSHVALLISYIDTVDYYCCTTSRALPGYCKISRTTAVRIAQNHPANCCCY